MCIITQIADKREKLHVSNYVNVYQIIYHPFGNKSTNKLVKFCVFVFHYGICLLIKRV